MNIVTRTQAIKNFLRNTATEFNRDLAALYDEYLECQVNVAQDNGERVEGNYQGKGWHGWTDGVQTWKSFRIPYEAKSNPHYDDPKMTFALEDHVEGIGLTGWNWKERKSIWVAYDFDSITGHKQGLTSEQLQEVLEKAKAISWVEIRRSTSGKGFHIY